MLTFNETLVRQPWAHVNVLFSRNIGFALVGILLYTLASLSNSSLVPNFLGNVALLRPEQSGQLLLVYGALPMIVLPDASFTATVTQCNGKTVPPRRSSSSFSASDSRLGLTVMNALSVGSRRWISASERCAIATHVSEPFDCACSVCEIDIKGSFTEALAGDDINGGVSSAATVPKAESLEWRIMVNLGRVLGDSRSTC